MTKNTSPSIIILICFLSFVFCQPVEAASTTKKTTHKQKATCVIKIGKLAKINIKF